MVMSVDKMRVGRARNGIDPDGIAAIDPDGIAAVREKGSEDLVCAEKALAGGVKKGIEPALTVSDDESSYDESSAAEALIVLDAPDVVLVETIESVETFLSGKKASKSAIAGKRGQPAVGPASSFFSSSAVTLEALETLSEED